MSGQLKPGPEFDALVVEKVMGWNQQSLKRPAPEFSTDIAAAWEVVEKLSKQWWVQIDQRGVGWFCDLTKRGVDEHLPNADRPVVYAETAPHAICLAALKVAGVDVK